MRKHMVHKMTAIAILAVGSLVGCGGGGGSSGTTTKTGYFIDSAVEGLEYTSGSTTGITGADGSFKYEEGKPVTFRIGNLTLGTITVAKDGTKIFPTDLVTAAANLDDPLNNLNVELIARILQSLDTSGSTADGITISSDLRAAMQGSNIQPIDLSTVDTTSLQTTNLLPAGRGLTDPTTAKNHLNGNLNALYIGRWIGTYTGSGDNGTCDVSAGIVLGTALAREHVALSGSCRSLRYNDEPASLTGNIYPSGKFNQTSGSSSGGGSVTTGAVFSGNFLKDGTSNGTWTNGTVSPSLTGTWTMTKQ